MLYFACSPQVHSSQILLSLNFQVQRELELKILERVLPETLRQIIQLESPNSVKTYQKNVSMTLRHLLHSIIILQRYFELYKDPSSVSAKYLELKMNRKCKRGMQLLKILGYTILDAVVCHLSQLPGIQFFSTKEIKSCQRHQRGKGFFQSQIGSLNSFAVKGDLSENFDPDV